MDLQIKLFHMIYSKRIIERKHIKIKMQEEQEIQMKNGMDRENNLDAVNKPNIFNNR